MQRHHIVQKAYLAQWVKNTQLQIYIISENTFIEKGTKWRGFYRENFNVLDDSKNEYYLPEKVTNVIDTAGIGAIRKINSQIKSQFSDEVRNSLAFYVALQYIRTPRFRIESDILMEKMIKHLMRADVVSPDKVHVTKKDILADLPRNILETESMGIIQDMTEEEFKVEVFNAIHSDDVSIKLSATGHSKGILKVSDLAEKLHAFQFLILHAPENSTFITSDNPCFVISEHKFISGPCGPSSITFFPLSPKICLCINAKIQSYQEIHADITEEDVVRINAMILTNSYECVVSETKIQLDDLVSGYDFAHHKKSREATIHENGDYVFINLE